MTNASTYDRTARDFKQGTIDKAAELASKAGVRLEETIAGAEATVEQAREVGRDAADRAGEVAGNMKGAIDKSLRDQPMTTLALAAVAGFVIGALWKS
jgi:ElaB/YqjD/DUF883 family membrane-anchored ribosome-binding protein